MSARGHRKRSRRPRKRAGNAKTANPGKPILIGPVKLADGEPDWNTPCQNCQAKPTVHPLELCGPCCFGEAATAGGNW